VKFCGAGWPCEEGSKRRELPLENYADSKLFETKLWFLAEPEGYVKGLVSRQSLLTVLIVAAKVGFGPVRSCCLGGGAIAE
jgi:hypothetical protein